MKKLFLIFIFASAFSLAQETKTKKPANKKAGAVALSIKITQTFSYCGGAHPSEETMLKLNTPKPISGKKFFIKKEEPGQMVSKIILEIRTDSAGTLKLNLPPGKYFVFDALKKDSSYYNDLIKKYPSDHSAHMILDKECLGSWLVTPDLTFTVSKNVPAKNLSINYYNKCFTGTTPCLTYSGPMPP